jgi:DNA-binding MarR family transcriptional regulator
MAQVKPPPRARKTAAHKGDSGAIHNGNGAARRFLRFSHIFSSVVQEVLEAKYLNEASTHPLSVPQFHLLKLIAINGKHQVGEVAEFLGVSSPAASKNIDKLEGLGLVTRCPSEGDRRATLLSASPKGRRLVRRYEDIKASRLAPVLNKFRPDDLQQFTKLLERFSVLLYQQESSDEGFCLRCAAYTDDDCPLGQVLGNCTYEKIRSRSRSAREVETEVP